MRACRFKVNQLVFAILLLLQLWCVRILAQHSDVSDNKKIIEEPERLSGVWETEIGSGKTIGLHFNLITEIEGSPTSLTRILQYEYHLDIGVYQKSGKDLKYGDQNYFSLSGDGAAFWDGKRLILKFAPPPTSRLPAIDLNLTYDEKQETWTGLFHRDSFSGDVTLRRPNADKSVAASKLAGTWAGTGSPDRIGCLHIVQRPDGTLEGWSDGLQLPGLTRYANGLKAPQKTFEYYGETINVSQTDQAVFSIEFGATSPMCCAHTFVGQLSADGALLDGSWQPGPNQSASKANWKRVLGDSCR
jgi:hypothetical protein